MKTTDSTFEKIIDAISIVSIVVLGLHFINNIRKNTETKLISNDGLNALQDKEKAKELRNLIDDYHKKGQWDNEKIQSIVK